jgi:CheY-like chemotaxis protein
MLNQFPFLYAEDEESDVLLLQHAFGNAGIRNPMHTVTDGKAAMEYLAGNGPFADRAKHPLPGLLLLDLNLPYWSGIEILVWLRQQEQLRRLPVLIFSSSSRPDDIAKAYDAGANGYLVKPSSFTEFEALAQALRDFWLLHNHIAETLGQSRAASPSI